MHNVELQGDQIGQNFEIWAPFFTQQRKMFLFFWIRATQKCFFLVKAGSGPRPRTKRVKNDCTLSANYYNIN